MDKFQLIFNEKFTQGDVLSNSTEEKLVITSKPKHIYGKWYHKLLNKLTFGKYFCEGWEYNVKFDKGR